MLLLKYAKTFIDEILLVRDLKTSFFLVFDITRLKSVESS